MSQRGWTGKWLGEAPIASVIVGLLVNAATTLVFLSYSDIAKRVALIVGIALGFAAFAVAAFATVISTRPSHPAFSTPAAHRQSRVIWSVVYALVLGPPLLLSVWFFHRAQVIATWPSDQRSITEFNDRRLCRYQSSTAWDYHRIAVQVDDQCDEYVLIDRNFDPWLPKRVTTKWGVSYRLIPHYPDLWSGDHEEITYLKLTPAGQVDEFSQEYLSTTLGPTVDAAISDLAKLALQTAVAFMIVSGLLLAFLQRPALMRRWQRLRSRIVQRTDKRNRS